MLIWYKHEHFMYIETFSPSQRKYTKLFIHTTFFHTKTIFNFISIRWDSSHLDKEKKYARLISVFLSIYNQHETIATICCTFKYIPISCFRYTYQWLTTHIRAKQFASDDLRRKNTQPNTWSPSQGVTSNARSYHSLK